MSQTRSIAAGWGLLALLLSGCSSDSSGNAGTMFNVARALLYPEKTSITMQQAGRVANASIGVRLGDSSQSMLVLAKFEPGQLWVAGQTLAIITRNGRVAETQGLDRNLTKLNPHQEGFPSLLPALQGQTIRTSWFADYADLKRFAVTIECEAKAVGPEQVTILDKPISTVRIDEVCNAPALKWAYTNHYWISPTSGIMWESMQYFHPNMDPLTIDVFRPMAG